MSRLINPSQTSGLGVWRSGDVGCDISSQDVDAGMIRRYTQRPPGVENAPETKRQPRMRRQRRQKKPLGSQLGLRPAGWLPRPRTQATSMSQIRLQFLIHPDPIAHHSLGTDSITCVQFRRAGPCKNVISKNAGLSCRLQSSPSLTHVQPAEINHAT